VGEGPEKLEVILQPFLSVHAHDVILLRSGNMNLDELLHFAGIDVVSTNIHLAAH